jgi:PAS domain S-box-containing protein
MKLPDFKYPIPWSVILTFLIFSLSVISGGIYYNRIEKNKIIIEEQSKLASILSLKVGQIIQWRKERIGDGEVISHNNSLNRKIKDYFINDKLSETNQDLRIWMESLIRNYDYQSIILIDKSNKIRLYFPVQDTVIGEIPELFITEVRNSHRVIMTDLHISEKVPNPHLDLLIPIIINAGRIENYVGTIILRIDAGKILFPLIQLWPTPSRSSETLLLRREGDSVLYLNELRHKANSALKLKFSVKNEKLPAAKASAGFVGAFEGIDYRNIPVLSYIKPIPDSPWFMVAKVDSDEIFLPFKKQMILTGVIAGLLILTFGFFIGLLWRNQRVRNLKKQRESDNKIKDASEKLWETNEYLENLINYTNAPLIVWDTNLKITRFNPAFERLTGMAAANVIGKSIEVIIPENSREEALRHIYSSTIGERWELVEIPIINIDGSTRTVLWNSATIYDNMRKHPVSTIAQGQDITKRIAIEKELMVSEKLYRSLFENMLNGFAYCRMYFDDNDKPSDFIYLAVNSSFETLTGLKNVTGRRISEVIPGFRSSEQTLLDIYGRVSRGSNPETIEIYVESLKMWFWISVYCPEPGYFVSVFDVITGRKLTEEKINELNKDLEERIIQRTSQLEESNKELEAFSYSVSHDLRAPLRAIHSFTSILKEDYDNILDDEGKRICEIIESSSVHMGTQIDDLLNFSRIGRSILQKSHIDMKAMAKSVFSELTTPLQKERIKLNLGKLHQSEGDTNLIKQVWNNLISNAIKYSSKNNSPEISIDSHSLENKITYSVKDNGVGFDMQYKNKLFGAFQRLHSSKEFEGNGVGLAIVQRIVKRHGGEVWAEGETGRGAIFYFSLPRMNPDHE